ncbi:chorismate synthase [Nonlabens tegetincola]|uniref:chorismate synthase n=1 Tax=Nonlabens tegetincola TaxID=323273 RepID=UPI000A20A515|nr:chorismate synthase [Nonlabens tegetincola]ARN71044.1 chorismate synthase [Nonlabens tegetincola]
MSKLNYLLATTLLFIIASCSSDDESPRTDFDYFPSSLNSSWNYDVTTDGVVSQDVLTISNETGSSFTLQSNPDPANGLMSTILTSGTLTKESGRLLGSGNLNLSFQGLNDFDISINNAPLYDQNAGANQELFSTTGMTTQPVQGYDLNIVYTARTVQQSDVTSLQVNGSNYSDVLYSQLIVNATITSDVQVAGFTTTVPVMNAQDVIVIDNYWVENVGLIKSDVVFTYQLEDFSSLGVNLPIPSTDRIESNQELTAYTIN